MVKTRIRNHERVFTWLAGRRPQTPAEASSEASLKIQRPQGAGRPCYEAEITPLAVENGVGELAAKARQMSARERELGELPPPNLSLFDRKVRQGLIVFGKDAGCALLECSWL